MNIKPVSKTNFGWNRTTHYEMTKLALKDSGLSDKDIRIIARYAQMPDYDRNEFGIWNNAHFYYPVRDGEDASKHKFSYGKGQSGYNNAFGRYKAHIGRALNGDAGKNDFYRNTGYALHFLQEVSVPVHTEKGGFLKKMADYYKHIGFERGKKYGATAKIKTLISNYKPVETSYGSSCEEIFQELAMYSQNKRLKVSYFNKKKWAEIQQECFNIGTDFSRMFLRLMRSKKNTDEIFKLIKR